MYRTYWGFEVDYRRLYVWIEGPDDLEFFTKVIKPAFMRKYEDVQAIQYAKQTKVWVNNYLKSIHAMGADYIFLKDMDGFPCISQRLDNIQHIYPHCVREKTQVVVQEIESWYLAGISEEDCGTLGLEQISETNLLTKEQFNHQIPRKFSSRRDFMSELLKRFSIQTAVNRNSSFRYFVEKYGILPLSSA
jgi:hypothetical protein